MKMRFPLFAIAAASVFAASCTSDKDLYDENYQNEVEKATYEQNFIKKFGNIASTQDWNLVEDYAVTVDPGTSKNIKIFAPSKAGVSKLVADYNVSGPKTLAFAAPEGTLVVYVVDEFGQVKAVNPNNGEVSFKATRSVNNITNTEGVKITSNSTANADETHSFEGKPYFGLVAKKLKFTVVFPEGAKKGNNNHSGYNAFGIYYYNLNHERIDVPVWTLSSEGESGGSNSHAFDVDFSGAFAEGTQVHWGLWVEDLNGEIWYDFGTHTDNKKNGTYINSTSGPASQSWTCIGFDMSSNENFKDLIFSVAATDIEVVDPDAFEWALACEDLGNTDDFDFNDVVFAASYVAGQTTMKVKPLAAGGVLNSEIFFNGTPITRNSEIHALLNAPANTITNTKKIDHSGDVIEIPVSQNFNLHKGMANFDVKVVDGENATRTITLPGVESEFGKVPQAICVPGDWFWPTERTSIEKAYPAFTNWVNTGAINGQAWWTAFEEGKVVVR